MIPGLNTDEYSRMMREAAEADKARDQKIFEPVVRETGVTHTNESIEAARQERLKRGER